MFGGGILWNGINRFLDWPYYMGGEGREPRGIASALWGLTVAVPIILAVMASRRRGGGQAPAEGRQRVIVIQVMYSLAGLVGSLAFYDSDVRSRIEGLSLGYDVQELVIGFVFALLISLLPLGVILMAGQGAGKSRPWTLTALGYALLPSFLVAAAVSFAFFVERPVAELEQLRGFLAGLMLRTGMYIAASL